MFCGRVYSKRGGETVSKTFRGDTDDTVSLYREYNKVLEQLLSVVGWKVADNTPSFTNASLAISSPVVVDVNAIADVRMSNDNNYVIDLSLFDDINGVVQELVRVNVMDNGKSAVTEQGDVVYWKGINAQCLIHGDFLRLSYKLDHSRWLWHPVQKMLDGTKRPACRLARKSFDKFFEYASKVQDYTEDTEKW